MLEITCALARQCFNDNVNGYAEREDKLASKRRDGLAPQLASEVRLRCRRSFELFAPSL
jgi:hypothetical protein